MAETSREQLEKQKEGKAMKQVGSVELPGSVPAVLGEVTLDRVGRRE
jgi:translation elongation factor EF-4